MYLLTTIVGLGALWDGFTTYFGIVEIFNIQDNPLQIIFAVVVAVVILGFLLSTHLIWTFETDDVVTIVLKAAWVICLVLNCYTAYIGNKLFVFDNKLPTGAHQFGLIIITLLITISSILLSRMIMAKQLRKRGYLY